MTNNELPKILRADSLFLCFLCWYLPRSCFYSFFQEVVAQNCVVIFSKTSCPYCRMAKNVFNEIGAAYKVIELDQHDDGRRLQEALAQMTGARTVRTLCPVLTLDIISFIQYSLFFLDKVKFHFLIYFFRCHECSSMGTASVEDQTPSSFTSRGSCCLSLSSALPAVQQRALKAQAAESSSPPND